MNYQKITSFLQLFEKRLQNDKRDMFGINRFSYLGVIDSMKGQLSLET